LDQVDDSVHRCGQYGQASGCRLNGDKRICFVSRGQEKQVRSLKRWRGVGHVTEETGAITDS
jgi:hypothetical protein